MTNLLHECPEVPLAPPARPATLTPAPDSLTIAHLAPVQMVATARRSGWPHCADQVQALAVARAALAAGQPPDNKRTFCAADNLLDTLRRLADAVVEHIPAIPAEQSFGMGAAARGALLCYARNAHAAIATAEAA